ncbi:MAG: four helix bundle protein [Bryobacteraceae bacterium]
MSGNSSFEELEVWKRSKALAVEVCLMMRECRDYGFRDQVTRSAVSVPSNILACEVA